MKDGAQSGQALGEAESAFAASPVESVAIRVPGSTSNCGAGFDTLGLALNVHNRVSLDRERGKEGVPERPADARAQGLVDEAVEAFSRATGRPALGFRYRIEGEVPPARGLGSSVTILAGVIAGLDALHGAGLSRRRLVELVADAEGHPDNASAGILGGFCVSRSDPATGAYVDTIRFEIPSGLLFAVASPAIELLTKESRASLPRSIDFFDAIRSVNSAAYLVAAFASGDYERLRGSGGDFLHEPHRLPRIPGARQAIDAGIAAGALTGWLSGSGSSVLCVCERAAGGGVVEAMRAAFSAASMPCEGRLLAADNRGLERER